MVISLLASSLDPVGQADRGASQWIQQTQASYKWLGECLAREVVSFLG